MWSAPAMAAVMAAVEPAMDEADGELGSWRVLRLVAGREVGTRVRSRAFQITTALFVVAIAASVLVTSAVGGGPSVRRVAVTAADGTQAAAIGAAARSLGVDVEVRTYADATAGRQAVLDGDVDALVLAAPPAGGAAGTGGGYRVVVDSELGDSLTSVLTVAARQAALEGQISALGGDPATVGQAVATAGVAVTALRPQPERDSARLVLGLLAGGLIYISLLIFGPVVAQSVIEEKTSRVVELLLAVIRPWQLMAGKVLGIGVVALGQLVLIGAVGVGLGLATGELGIPAGVAVGSVALALLWYLVGFAMYALMFAAAGALVSRQEDAGGVTAPMIAMILIPYVLGFSVLPSSPDSGLILALAIVPLFAPILMPMVIGIGSVAVWQVLVALALTLAWIAVLVWLAGRVYGNAVKRSGTRVALRDALRAA
ncbi:ABC-type Na+ efflux pump, permease component [Frankia torreyi]|uniref:ABC-type Na+ efflux pump, permease component n=2 Tax=Frankiaceae TaxID=74712 RepID=A0A0D8BMV6_9ACTN|nr:ABC-type Na+ efflux pump, permease component [Frankia torreyi]KQM07850.1 ABC-type Na+ efflux pump, permease component [Frankia sp. CpI1-P]